MKVKKPTFSRLSAAAKRVAIAKDILKQIEVGQYNIEQGSWLNVSSIELANVEYKLSSRSRIVQQALLGGKQTMVIDAPPASCTCCAVGAACASAIRLFNQDVLSGSLERGYALNDYQSGLAILGKYFPKEQIDMMEAAFEQRSDSLHKNASRRQLEDAVYFGQEHSDDEARLKAICQNIIKNKGDFKP